MATVAHDVTAEGPSAWRRHFADDPAFFMAADGRLAFDGSSATQTIQSVAHNFPHIDLAWNDLRIDPLAPNLAAVGASYRETLVNSEGARMESAGYFTGTVEYRAGRWQFRNAHWSVPVPSDAH